MASTDGLLLVDKPAGLTSHDVVAIARRALGVRRVGHAGSLDPFATGLLVLLVGRATRLLPFLDDEPKDYDAVIRFGVATDTDDLTGEPRDRAPLPDEVAVRSAIPSLTGTLEQLPPAYSAKQVDGVRAHRAARRGAPLALAPARVAVHAWTIRHWEPPDLAVTVRCSSGTYIRALARDLGRAAGSAAHLAVLRRTRAGAFGVERAITIDALRGAAPRLLPPRDAVPSLATVALDDADCERVARGMAIDVEGESAVRRAALLDADGALVAVAERDGDRWRPRVVLRNA